MRLRVVLVLVAAHALGSVAHGSEILMVTMGGTKSHKIPFMELAHGLLKRGHNITFINAFPPDRIYPRLEEVTPPGLVFYVRNYTNWDLLGARIRNEEPVAMVDVLRYGFQACEALLFDPEIQHLLGGGRNFDLLILDGAFPDCALGFAHHYKAPFIFINTVAFYTESLSYAGNPSPWSVTPFFARPLTDQMTVVERAQNAGYHFLVSTMHTLMVRLFLQNIMLRMWPDIPSVLALTRNVSFTLQNSHPTISYPRPYLPNVAEIGCIHCKPAKPLPQDLEEFVTGSGDAGFIYVSMGSSVKASNMPEYLRLLFVNVFAQLPYRVLWKWEAGNGSMADLPSNVWLSRWLPQQDVLGHRKIRAFVTHGGLLSIFETVYHGVPVVTMPVFCDQDSNAMKAEVDGYALKVELHQITAKRLLKAINTVIRDQRYRENVVKRSVLLRDQPETPLSRAIYWTEYVIRHRGAPHLQSNARYMSVAEYYMLDVAAILLVALVVAAMLARRASKMVSLAGITRWTARRSKTKQH